MVYHTEMHRMAELFPVWPGGRRAREECWLVAVVVVCLFCQLDTLRLNWEDRIFIEKWIFTRLSIHESMGEFFLIDD